MRTLHRNRVLPLILAALSTLMCGGLLCIQLFGETGEDYLKKGLELIGEGQYDQALVALDRFKQSDPMDSRSYIYSGVALTEAGRTKDANMELNQALSLRNPDPRDAIVLSRTLAKLGRVQLASRLPGAAMPPPPLYTGLNLDVLDAEDLWYLSDLHYHLEQTVSAQEVLEIFARRKPADSRIGLRHGQILVMEGKLNEALDFLQTAAEAAPGSGDAQFSLGQVLYLLTRAEALTTGMSEDQIRERREWARDAVLRAVEITPGQVEYLQLLGTIYLELGDYTEAATWMERALEALAEPVQVEFDLSLIYQQVGEQERARQAKLRYKVYLELSRAYKKAGESKRAQEAMVQYKKMYQAEEEQQERLRQLGSLLDTGIQQTQSGKVQEALSTFLSAIEMDPDNWGVRNYVALFYMSFRLPARAFEHIQKMLNLDPNAADGHYFMALYWFQQQKLSLALEYAQTAKSFRPGKPELRMLLGDILVSLNHQQDALLEYDAARKLAPQREVFQTRYETLSKRLTTDG